jgi:hypothetical protein
MNHSPPQTVERTPSKVRSTSWADRGNKRVVPSGEDDL